MRLTILVDNYVYSQKLKAEHGLSILIEHGDESILFDCGQSDIVLSNAKIMGIDLNKITKIVLSHGHFDHTGGLLPILKYLNRGIDVYAHPLIFSEKLSRQEDFNGSSINRYIGIPEKKETYEKKGARFLLINESEKISRDVYFSGKINKSDKEISDNELYTRDNDIYIKDPLHDDISLFIDLPETLVSVTGCAHSGILNILNMAKEMELTSKKIAIIGGLHLSKKDDFYIDNIIREFNKYNIELLVPMHCAGIDAYVKLKNKFGTKCTIGAIGRTLEF